GVVELTQWFERMETVFRISNCLTENQTKFATCTLLAGALMWWNSHIRIVGSDAAYVMTWIELKKKMADKYCPSNEMKKIETELWNLEVQVGTGNAQARVYAVGNAGINPDANTVTEAEGKLEKKRLENVPIVRDFPEVFPEDLPGLPPNRQVGITNIEYEKKMFRKQHLEL
nr:reverse transcriptase domain-containing protein [Tanacetum cinerariifolium]